MINILKILFRSENKGAPDAPPLDPRMVSFPRMREIAHQTCFYWVSFFSWSLQRPTAQAQASEPIFTQNTSNDVVPCKDVPFGVRKQKNIYSRLFSRNRHFWARF